MSKNGNSCRAHRAYGDRWEGGTKGLEPTSRALLLLLIRFGDARRPARRRFSNVFKFETGRRPGSPAAIASSAFTDVPAPFERLVGSAGSTASICI